MASSAKRLGEFASALLNPALPTPTGLCGPDGKPSARRFAVYRNNVFAGLTSALQSAFPRTARLVGEEFFTAMARVFAAAHPPTSPVLLHYGAEFPAFVAAFPPAATLPYLADVARIERATTEAYHAPEADALGQASLAGVPPERAHLLQFTLHPSVRLIRSPHPAFAIWQMNEDGVTPWHVDLAGAQYTMVLRPQAEVEVRQVQHASFDFLAALRRGLTLAGAIDVALAVDAEFDLSQNLQELLNIGVFADFGIAAQVPEDDHA